MILSLSPHPNSAGVCTENAMDSFSEDIPYKLSYRISSAYEQLTDSNPTDNAVSTKQTVSKHLNDGGNGDKLRFLHYDDVDCFVFPQIDVVDLGGLQLSVFHIDCDKFQVFNMFFILKFLDFIFMLHAVVCVLRAFWNTMRWLVLWLKTRRNVL